MSRAGAAPPGSLRRWRSPASRAPADHPAAVRVNRDASHFCSAPDSDASDRHARAAPGGCSGNAVRQHAARGAGLARRSLRHSKFGRDRSSCKSRSGRGNRRTETAGLAECRDARTATRHVDERRDCRDIVPACVPSTVWGTASMRNRQVVLGAVLAPQGRNATPPLVTASAAHAPQRLIAPTTRRPRSSNRRQASSPALPGGRYHPTNSGNPRQIDAGPCSHRQSAEGAHECCRNGSHPRSPCERILGTRCPAVNASTD